MKRTPRLLILLLAFLMSVSLISCSGGEEEGIKAPDGFLLAENEGADYYFFYPDTWLLDRHDAGMSSAFVSESDYSNVSVTVFTASAEYPSLVDYAENYYLKQFEGHFEGLSVKRNQDGSLKRNVLKIDDRDAISFEYSAKFGEKTYSFCSWIISDGGYLYTVLYTAEEEKYLGHWDVAEKIATSVRFK
ncbi:MAG: hypothetical protein IKD31_01445 [Clostridia bacterium]|nr:hypothetical protein [Clostridia bacterium]